MTKQKSIIVQNIPVQLIAEREMDYVCITDRTNAKQNESRAADIIKNRIRNRYTLEFLGTWEQMYIPREMFRRELVLKIKRSIDYT